MKLRTQLNLAFIGLAVVPMAAITLYSYNTSLNALHAAAKQESSAMAEDMSSRMESVSKDINHRIERFAAFEFRRIMALEKKDRDAATAALTDRLKAQLGEDISFLKSLEFTPADVPKDRPPRPHVPPLIMSGQSVPGDAPSGIMLDLSGEGGGGRAGGPENGRKPPLSPFPGERFDTELRSGTELVGKISASIRSQQLLHSVLVRTQPRQGEIPFALDGEGKLYTTNPDDQKKIENLPIPRGGTKTNLQQEVSRSSRWIIVTRKDTQSGFTFGIARPIGDGLGDLRRTTMRNLGYGLAMVVLAMIGIIPLSSRMTRNLTVLTREAEALAHGDLQARAKVNSKDEFGNLAQAFNRMAEDLSENQKRLIAQEKLQNELEMCRKIQEELLPRQSLRSGDVEIKGVSIPAREVGGDFFNYFSMPDGSLALLVGDVSGKGLPAALLMANLQATIQARLPLELDLVKLAEQLDDEISVSSSTMSFLTLFIAVLDSKTRRMRYVNAGHNPQFVLHSDGSIDRLHSTGRPIGLLAGGGFQEKIVPLRDDDSLFFYTDGLVEAEDEAGREFGMTRLEKLLVDERSRGLEGLLAKVEEVFGQHRGHVEASDDATMMLVKIGALS